jgi:hypothetical protein
MAKRFLLLARDPRSLWWEASPRSQLERLREAVEALGPDDALFVSEERGDGASEPRRLRVRLRNLLVRQQVAFVEDADRGGIWV